MTADGFLTPKDVTKIRELAVRGISYNAIAGEIGCDPSTVCRYAKGLGVRPSRSPDMEKTRLVVARAETVPPGERYDLARSLGYANLASFNAQLCRFRKRLAALSSTEGNRA
jgi:hypothetical protein